MGTSYGEEVRIEPGGLLMHAVTSLIDKWPWFDTQSECDGGGSG